MRARRDGRRGTARGRAQRAALALAVLAGTVLAGLSAPPASAASTPAGVPAAPASLATPAAGPGTVVSSAPLAAPLPGRATKVRYRTTDTAGRPVIVSGTVIVPLAPPPGPLRLISYAVGTQGMADRCAPSAQFAAGTEYESGFISSLLTRGYAVAVTDYQGLGTPGTHTYVNRLAEAHAVLDVARAARRLGVGIPANGPVALAGYSQGGGASAAAAEIAPRYAPDVGLVGAYAGAVPADLAVVGSFLDGKPAAGLLGYSLNSFQAAYPELRIPDQLNARGRTFLAETNEQCVGETVPRYPGLRSTTLTRDGRSLDQLLSTEPYRTRVEQQRIGTVAPAVPTYVAHSVADDIVPFPQDAAMVASWCARGARVQFVPLPAPSHVAGAVAAAPGAFAFLEARFAGRPTPTTC